MEDHERPAEGCLAAVVRWPARALAFAVVLPVRFVWELLVLAWRPVRRGLGLLWWLLGRICYGLVGWPLLTARRYLVLPLLRGLARAGLACYRYVLTPIGHGTLAVLRAAGRGAVATGRGLALLARAVYRYVLAPVGRGTVLVLRAAERALGWLVATLVFRPLAWTVAYLLVPLAKGLLAVLLAVGHGLLRTGGALLALAKLLWAVLVLRPGGWLGHRVLRPGGRGLVVALTAAGVALLAAGRGLVWLARNGVARPLAWLVRWGLVAPLVWLWARVLTPIGRGLAHGAELLGRGIGAGLSWLGRGIAAGLTLLGRGIGWCGRHLLLAPARWFLRAVLAPLWHGLVELLSAGVRVLVWLLRTLLLVLHTVGRALGWLLRSLVLVPLGWLWRVLLYPVLRTVGQLLVRAWRLAGRLWRYLVVRPCRWLRRDVWWPVKDELRRAWASVREAGREARRALLGGTGRTLDADRSPAGAQPASRRTDPLTKD